jgi:hypothetical protein
LILGQESGVSKFKNWSNNLLFKNKTHYTSNNHAET